MVEEGTTGGGGEEEAAPDAGAQGETVRLREQFGISVQLHDNGRTVGIFAGTSLIYSLTYEEEPPVDLSLRMALVQEAVSGSIEVLAETILAIAVDGVDLAKR